MASLPDRPGALHFRCALPLFARFGIELGGDRHPAAKRRERWNLASGSARHDGPPRTNAHEVFEVFRMLAELQRMIDHRLVRRPRLCPTMRRHLPTPKANRDNAATDA
jgi:hypothetical protein